VENARGRRTLRILSKSDIAVRLDGFLYAISSFSGRIRENEISAYVIDCVTSSDDICGMINQYYSGQHYFSFGLLEEMPNGTRDLNTRIKSYLIRDDKCVADSRIPELKSYLCLRVMDMIKDFFDQNMKSLRVFEVRDEDAKSPHDITFFCVISIDTLLVLQFNRYLDVRKQE
jgi:hypothetical protein